MTIKFYPSTMPGEPLETHEWTGTLGAWLDSENIEWREKEQQPIFATLNGQQLSVDRWDSVSLASTDDLRIYPIANGSVFKGLGNLIGSIFGSVLGFLLPSQSSSGRDYRAPNQGRQLEAADGKANVAKLGEVVPELAGHFIRFPDYLTPPRRYFSNPREQWLEFLACVGPGTYQINPDSVKVGETPINSLGDDGQFQIFQPNTDLSGVTAHEHWHTTEEVGGTSSGTAGLELSTDISNRNNSQPASYTFDGNTITRSNGRFPVAWGSGTVVSLNVSVERTYSVVTGSTFPQTPATFTGDFSQLTPLQNGDTVTVVSQYVSGTYLAQNVSIDAVGYGTIELWSRGTPSSPVISFPAGDHVMTFGTSRELTLSGSTDTVINIAGGIQFAEFTAPATIQYASGTVYGEWTSEFVLTPGGETTDTIELDVFFPRGLCFLTNEGNVQNRSVRVEFQYRDSDGGGTPVTVSRTYNEATNDQIGFSVRLTIPRMRPAVRVRRVGAESTSTQEIDTVHWYQAKARLATRTRYPNWTTMSVRLRSGGRIAAQSENQINLEATRILPTLQTDGSWSSPQPTRDITAFARYILSTIDYAGRIDEAEWLRLHNLWQSRGDTLDHLFDLTTVKQALGLSFRAGMGEYTVTDGLIRPVREGIRTQFEQAYSTRNMTTPLTRSFQSHRHDDPDGVQIEYTDADTWSKKYIDCAYPDSQKIKLVKLKLDGITDRTRAWRFGMREAAKQRYIRWSYQFKTPTDALNSEYLSYVPLFDDTVGYGRTSLMTGISGTPSATIVESNEPFEFDGDGVYVIAFRGIDGRFHGPFEATQLTDNSVMTSIPTDEWPSITLKNELPHVFFGKMESYCYPAIVTSIKPSSLDDISVEAVNYDARVFQFDDDSPDA